jgi:peptide/nickel transport system permease protein
MLAVVLKRLLHTIPVLFGVTVLVFLMLYIAPGDPAEALLGPTRTAETLERAREDMGLNDPIFVQYGRWLGNALRGDLGDSYRLNRSVAPVVMERLGNSAIIASFGFAIALMAGTIIGVYSSIRRRSVMSQAVMGASILGISFPPFFLGMLLVLIFSVRLDLLPTGGMYPVRGESSPAQILIHAILPSMTLAAVPTTVIARMVRSSMLEVASEDYIRTAHAKGLREMEVVIRHALKNAMVPVASVIGLQIGYLLSSAALVEVVFSWPGLGSLLVTSVTSRDFPLIQASVLVLAVIYIAVNLLVDLIQSRLDPRIKFS